ncbi:MAG: AEC family transporter [Methanobrevibacter sp.]|nr:AEC family transporter [Methanobrevibacter sp.]
MASVETTIIAIFVMVFLGYTLKKIDLLKETDVDTLNKIVINVALPSMVFITIYKTDFSILQQIATLPLVGIIVGSLCGIFMYLVFTLKKFPEKKKWALILPVCVGNTGFFGFPVTLGIFGSEGLIRAIFYDVSTLIMFLSLSAILMFKFGGRIKDSLKSLFRFPSLWAVILGIMFNFLNLPIGEIFDISINYLAAATIPLIMISLGLSLQFKGIKEDLKSTSSVAFIKLIFSPILAIFILGFLGFSTLEYSVGIIEASMPCSMLMLVLAIEHDLDFKLTANCIVISTVFSILTIPLLMGIL